MIARAKASSVPSAHHPGAYQLHKYWSRKPHNVLATLFARHRRESAQLFVDPFCGSGVGLSEASALGFEVAGGDVNPIAIALSRVTLAPPPVEELTATVAKQLDALERSHGELYWSEKGPLRYAVHALCVMCLGCGETVVASEAVEAPGRRCPHCGARLRFNLQSMTGTKVVRVARGGDRLSAIGPDPLEDRRSASAPDPGNRFVHPLCSNNRLLAFDGLTTASFFTPRNFATLSAFAEAVHAIEDERVRSAALLVLTGASAQCSRLIAFRNDLTTGGPAWSLPGFWVPPLHLEANPFLHLRARLDRISRGLRQLSKMPGRVEQPAVERIGATKLLQRLASEGRKADLVFLDPPYGDSVPYLESSAIWNGFLGERPDPADDLSVSDRLPEAESWRRYRDGLAEVARAAAQALSRRGVIVAAFNSNDERAWSALRDAIAGAGLRVREAFHQDPAVVPSKTQLAPENSYQGEYYCTLARA